MGGCGALGLAVPTCWVGLGGSGEDEERCGGAVVAALGHGGERAGGEQVCLLQGDAPTGGGGHGGLGGVGQAKGGAGEQDEKEAQHLGSPEEVVVTRRPAGVCRRHSWLRGCQDMHTHLFSPWRQKNYHLANSITPIKMAMLAS